MKILFLCTHNACRSILAEALCRHLAGGRFEVASAGSAPAGRVHPRTLAFLAEQGIDGAGLYSKSWEQLAAFRPDLVITVCDQAAGESCPLWFGQAAKAHWGLADPSRLEDDDAARRGFEQIATLLSGRIKALLDAEVETLSAEQLHTLINRLGEAV